MKPRIFEVKDERLVGGFYMPIGHYIVIDEGLRKYPELRQLILKHEIEHSRLGVNFLGNVLLDMFDAWPINLRKDFMEYQRSKKTKLGFYYLVQAVHDFLYVVFSIMSSPLFLVYALLVRVMREIKNEV
ncbi:MAG: hypothetical protein NTU61_06045 [Candidatus Altiarchaeota archaeon]|nr:hypothetical protein [Candidatus Altiarchaeota archaeon]